MYLSIWLWHMTMTENMLSWMLSKLRLSPLFLEHLLMKVFILLCPDISEKTTVCSWNLIFWGLSLQNTKGKYICYSVSSSIVKNKGCMERSTEWAWDCNWRYRKINVAECYKILQVLEVSWLDCKMLQVLQAMNFRAWSLEHARLSRLWALLVKQ